MISLLKFLNGSKISTLAMVMIAREFLFLSGIIIARVDL